MVDITNGRADARPCRSYVCGKCSVLRTKCLEDRWFGGVPYGTCAIRVVKTLPCPPDPPVPADAARTSCVDRKKARQKALDSVTGCR